MKKYGFYRDGLCPQLLARVTVDGDELLAEYWDYKDEKWVPDAGAWETIDDERGNWAVPSDGVQDYIESMLERFPWLKECNIQAEPEGAKRKKNW